MFNKLQYVSLVFFVGKYIVLNGVLVNYTKTKSNVKIINTYIVCCKNYWFKAVIFQKMKYEI